MMPAGIKPSTRKILQGFPAQVRADIGTELLRVQYGLDPVNWKPMPSIGKGVREIRVSYRGQWRLVYIAKFEEAVYVLHAFQKKTRKTKSEDIELAKQRLSEVLKERKK